MATSDCPNNGRRVQALENGKFVNFCVSVSPDEMTQNQAVRFCASQGGSLKSK